MPFCNECVCVTNNSSNNNKNSKLKLKDAVNPINSISGSCVKFFENSKILKFKLDQIER